MPQQGKKKFFTKNFNSRRSPYRQNTRPPVDDAWTHDKFIEENQTKSSKGFTTNKANKASILSRLGGNEKSKQSNRNQGKQFRTKKEKVDTSLTVMIQPSEVPVSSLTSQLSERVSEGLVSDRLFPLEASEQDPMALDQAGIVSPPHSASHSSLYTIEVSNLHPDATLEDIRSAFSEFGPVHKVTLVADREGRSTGVAKIAFLGKESATAAIEMLHNQVADGRVLKVVYIESGISIAGAAQQQNRPLAGLVTAFVPQTSFESNTSKSLGSGMYSDRLEAVSSSFRPASRVNQVIAQAALDAARSTTR